VCAIKFSLCAAAKCCMRARRLEETLLVVFSLYSPALVLAIYLLLVIINSFHALLTECSVSFLSLGVNLDAKEPVNVKMLSLDD